MGQYSKCIFYIIQSSFAVCFQAGTSFEIIVLTKSTLSCFYSLVFLETDKSAFNVQSGRRDATRLKC